MVVVPLVRRFLHRFLYPRSLRFGLKRDAGSRFRDPRFVSFLAETNRKALDTDLQDAILRGRRLCKQGLILLVAAGGAWIVLESAKALSVF